MMMFRVQNTTWSDLVEIDVLEEQRKPYRHMTFSIVGLQPSAKLSACAIKK